LGVELEGRPLLRSTKPEEELAVQCIHQVSMLLAEEGDEANAATATACPNLRPTNRPPVAAVQTLPRKAQEHEADQTLPRKAQDRKESPRSLNMLPRKTSSPPHPPNVPVQDFTGTEHFLSITLSIHMDTKGDEGSVDEVRTSVGR
jgi:hypothetical protein